MKIPAAIGRGESFFPLVQAADLSFPSAKGHWTVVFIGLDRWFLGLDQSVFIGLGLVSFSMDWDLAVFIGLDRSVFLWIRIWCFSSVWIGRFFNGLGSGVRIVDLDLDLDSLL
jgi:hypothetical protein